MWRPLKRSSKQKSLTQEPREQHSAELPAVRSVAQAEDEAVMRATFERRGKLAAAEVEKTCASVESEV